MYMWHNIWWVGATCLTCTVQLTLLNIESMMAFLWWSGSRKFIKILGSDPVFTKRY